MPKVLKDSKGDFSPVRIAVAAAITVLVGALLKWGIWVTQSANCADQAKKKIDHQTTVLHNRITDQDKTWTLEMKRLNDKIDKNQTQQTQNYQDIMKQLLQIQRDMRND